MTSYRRTGLLLATLALGLGGCTDVFGPSRTYVAITEIELANEEDSGTLLEVEVHLYDADSGSFLGCSGEADGLADVDESGVAYLVEAFFARPPLGRTRLAVEDVIGRDLFAVVVEDDHEPCPVPTNEGTFDLVTDDLIGTSPVFRGEDLDAGVAFGFDDVAWLALEGVR